MRFSKLPEDVWLVSEWKYTLSPAQNLYHEGNLHKYFKLVIDLTILENFIIEAWPIKIFKYTYLIRYDNFSLYWLNLCILLQKEGHLTWTDGSSFDLKKNEIFSFPLLPKNETHCYILQQNATGPNYFFARFFCYVSLPYICKYESNYFLVVLCLCISLFYNFKNRIIIYN